MRRLKKLTVVMLSIILIISSIAVIDEDAAVSAAGNRSIKGFLQTALKPLGTTMYIYGGGWNEEDTGAGIEARTIGLSSNWATFAAKQTSSYNYKDYDYKKNVSVIHDGLDCSGYMGWVIYNTLETTSGGTGYVDYNNKVFKNLESRGYGTLVAPGSFSDYKPGDILTSSSHMWICLGSCSDGSVVILHSSPPGVQINGTPTPSGNTSSEAIRLARYYMSTYYSSWYSRYSNVTRGTSYFSGYHRFRWSSALSDSEGYRSMTAGEVLEDLFGSSPDDSTGVWKQNSTGWWFEYSDGSYPASAWAKVKGKWYYFNSRGYMTTGWQKVKGYWYYMDASGAMQTGWIRDGGVWYYLNQDGDMATGWIKEKGKWYYLNSSGAMAVGWKKTGTGWYYLKSSGAMAESEYIGSYYVDENGRWVE